MRAGRGGDLRPSGGKDHAPRGAGADMSLALIDPSDPPERQRDKLLEIVRALMARVERTTDDGGAAYAQFQRAAMLEDQVRERTADLQRTLELLNLSNERLAEATRAAEEARQNLANAIETVQEGFALFDADDVLVLCNSRFGMHMLDIQEHLKPGLSFGGYIDRVSRSRYLALPEAETPEDWAVRRKRRHYDRHSIFNVRLIWDRWLQVSEHRTADGGTVILQTDVTDLIRIERLERGKMLDDQARVIRATLDHINQGVCIFDAEGRLVGWNQRLGSLLAIPMNRFRLGVSFGYLLERFAHEISFGEGMDAAHLEAWVQARHERAPLSFELRRHDELILDVFAQEMPDRGFVMSFTDVTAERAAIEALSRANETLEARVMERTLELEDALGHAERANASRSRFVAAASHDLLQPLSAAKLFIATIGDEAVAPESREALTKAQKALDSVEGILGALLDISKLESGRAAVSIQPVRLDRLMAQLSDEFAPIAAARPPAHGAALERGGGLRPDLSPADPPEPDRQCDPLHREGQGACRRADDRGHGAAGGLGHRAGDRRGRSGRPSSRSSTGSTRPPHPPRAWGWASPSSSAPAGFWAIRWGSDPRSGGAPASCCRCPAPKVRPLRPCPMPRRCGRRPRWRCRTRSPSSSRMTTTCVRRWDCCWRNGG